MADQAWFQVCKLLHERAGCAAWLNGRIAVRPPTLE